MIGAGLLALALIAPSARASVNVDTSEVGSDGPIIKRRVLERSDVVLRANDVLPSDSPDDVQIKVHVEEFDRGGPGFLLHLDVETLGHHEEIECALCTETELVARYEERLQVLAKQLAAQAGAEPDPVPPDPDPTPPDQPPPPDDDGKLRATGKAGIALTVIGAAGVGVGIGLALAPAQPKRNEPLEETTTEIPGYVTLGVGAAVLVTGVALIVVDRLRARKRTTVAPTLGPATAGISLTTRF
jgi:hypothetical protein